jgi:hypothetical protein
MVERWNSARSLSLRDLLERATGIEPATSSLGRSVAGPEMGADCWGRGEETTSPVVLG